MSELHGAWEMANRGLIDISDLVNFIAIVFILRGGARMTVRPKTSFGVDLLPKAFQHRLYGNTLCLEALRLCLHPKWFLMWAWAIL